MTGHPTSASRRWALIAGRALLVAGCAFALLFAVASRIGEGFSVGGLLTGIGLAGLIALLVALAWRAPHLGGWLLVIIALSLASLNPTNAASLMIAAPPFLVGALFIWGSRPAGKEPRS